MVTDKDRLGREQFEASYNLKQISVAGVRIVEAKNGGTDTVREERHRAHRGDGHDQRREQDEYLAGTPVARQQPSAEAPWNSAQDGSPLNTLQCRAM